MERLKKIKSEYGKVQLGNITVDMVLGGMRGMTGLRWETSLLDADEGIRFRGLSIPECQKVLPAAKPGGEPLPEGLLWLLLTGKIYSKYPHGDQYYGMLSAYGPQITVCPLLDLICLHTSHLLGCFFFN